MKKIDAEAFQEAEWRDTIQKQKIHMAMQKQLSRIYRAVSYCRNNSDLQILYSTVDEKVIVGIGIGRFIFDIIEHDKRIFFNLRS